MKMRPTGAPVTGYTNDVNRVNIQRSGDPDNGIKDESLLNLSARVQNLMNASLTTEEVEDDGAAETSPEEEPSFDSATNG